VGDIKKQSISNTALSYLGAVLGFLIIYLQPHLITSADIGLLRLLYSFSWLVAIVMPFGTGSAMMRYFPKIHDPGSKHHGFFALVLLIGTCGALIIATVLLLNKTWLNAFFINSPQLAAHITDAVFFAYILSLISLYTVFASALFKTTFTVFLTDIFTRLGQILVVLMYHWQWIGREAFVLSYIGVFLVQLLLLVLYLYKHKAVSFSIDFAFFRTFSLRQVGLFAVIMMMTGFASLGIKMVDQLMVGHFVGESAVGIYATCVMICVVMEIPFNSLDRIASPKMSYAWNINDRAEVHKIYAMSSRYMFFVGGFLFCLLWAANDLIFLYLPAEYSAGRMSFYLVAIASLINLTTGINSSVITFSSRYFVLSSFLLALICVAVAANYIFIPRIGITGAALATLISVGVFNALKYFYILWRFEMQPFSIYSSYTAGCVIICAMVLVILPATLNPYLKFFCGAAFTGIVFSLANIRYDIVPEVNKVFRRMGLLRP
jgi:O-antigen/teichoic acid export membrane protein